MAVATTRVARRFARRTAVVVIVVGIGVVVAVRVGRRGVVMRRVAVPCARVSRRRCRRRCRRC